MSGHSRYSKKVSITGACRLWECKNTEFVWEVRNTGFCGGLSRAVRLQEWPVRRTSTSFLADWCSTVVCHNHETNEALTLQAIAVHFGPSISHLRNERKLG